MAHEIEARDVQAGIEMAWHRLTKVVPVVNFGDAFPFEVKREGIQSESGEPIPGFSVFTCSDDGKIAGKPMADSYSALSNEEFWGTCREALEGTGAIVESAGTIMDRSRRFMTIRLGDDSRNIGGRVFLHRISLIDSLDGSTRFHAVNTSTCVVCANTARMVMGDMSGEFHFKVKHSKGFRARLENTEAQIESMLGVRAEFEAALRLAAEEPLAQASARNLFAGFLGDGEPVEPMTTRTRNTVNRLTSLFNRGAGNKGETLLDAVSAVTDFYSHESAGGDNRWKQYISSEFGSGARFKTDFLSALFATREGKVTGIDRAGINRIQRHGEILLNA